MKKFWLFALLFGFYVTIYAAEEGDDLCDPICIPPNVMADIHGSNLLLERAPEIIVPIINFPRTIPFNVTMGNNQQYEVHSLTNFADINGNISDLVSSIKLQGYGDCTRFASTGAIEIKLAKQYATILHAAQNTANNAANNVQAGFVEANLSEAYAKEIAGCQNHTINVMKRLSARGIIQEEHYPYHARSFGEFEYLSKRNIGRYGDFYNKSCGENGSWNSELRNKAKQNQWLRFYPGFPMVIDNINDVKNYIKIGEPVVMTYDTDCMFRNGTPIEFSTDPNTWNMGKFTHLIPKDNRIPQNGGGHAVIIVGYMAPTNNGNGPDYFIVKNSHYFDNKLELFTVDQNFTANCNPKYNIFGSIKVFKEGSEDPRVLDEPGVLSEPVEPDPNTYLSASILATIDIDNDNIPDIFDNSVYSGIYNSSNVSYNPAQNVVDGDKIPLEKDLCPYIEDLPKADMDMDGIGDYCDEDIDGDGISNISEGLSRAYLYQLTSLTESEYAALNPFIDGRSGKVVNKYFVSKAFREGKEVELKENYISSIDFYLMPFNDSEENPPVFQFVKDKNYYHDWYLNINAPGEWIRKFSYKDERHKLHDSYGLRWNIPGLFEMSRISYQQYKRANYGENYPESFYNCMLHCEKLSFLYVMGLQEGVNNNIHSNIIDLSKCRQACTNAYQCTQGQGIDRDCDGIRNEYDVCPDDEDLPQWDSDGDGVPNVCDNCPNTPNKMEINNSEIVVAPCANGDGGAFCMGLSSYKDADNNWQWQPDHNLNGIGDACDIEDGTIENSEFVEWAEFAGIPQGNSIVEFVNQNSQEEHGYIRKNETLAVTIDMKSTNPTKKDEIATTRYCWLPEWDQNSWGTDGHCTTESGHNPDYDNCNDTNFGYSHGTEPVPVNEFGEENWKFIKQKNNQRESDEFTTITTNERKTINWDWRYDLRTDDDTFENALTTPPQCENVPLGVCMDQNVPKFYYTMSTGVYSGDPDEDYIKNNEINPAFFKNDKKYTRSSRLLVEPVIISYHKEFFMTVFPPKYCHGAPCNFPMEWLHDMIIDRLIHGPLPFEMPITEHYFKNDYGSNLINTGVAFREWNKNALGMPSVVEKSRPLLLLTITKNASGMNEGILAVQNNTIFSLRNIQEAVSSNFTFEIVTMDANSNGDWRTKGILDVSNVPHFMPTVSTYHNRELYVVSKNGGNTAHIYRIDKTDQTTTPQQFINICPLRWIFAPIDLGSLIDLSKITLHSVGNSLFALGKSGNVMKIFKLSELNGEPYFAEISSTNMPEGRDVYNVEIQDDVLYLAGGAGFGENSADLKTDIWSFTETDGWQLIRNDINMFPVTLRIDFDGDNIILTDRVIRPNGTTNRAIFPADGTGDIVIETVPVEGANVQGFGDYCLKETGTALQGGIETSGECVPFTHPWYNSFSAGATVYSLAGKGNRLYVGTNNAIKVYDISDPISPVLVSSFSTNSRVNDLEVYGDTLFAATNGGLYKLDASNDTLTQTLFVSAFLNYQYKVEVYNGKLYVGDDSGIKVRDLETLSVLTSVNNGSVLDFAIEDGEIGLYKDALFSPVEIRDADTLTLKANEFFGCFEIEVGSSDGRFYLSCDDETYRFEDDGDGGVSFSELSGDIRELQDVYTFDGYTYLYNENTIWISTSSDVPAICGNGIVEGDEVCDGGQIDCSELDSNYVSGTAACNSTCDGYNTNNCSDDGW